MAVLRSLVLYRGSGLSPTADYTDATDWPATQFTTMADAGQAGSSSWSLRDEDGTIPDYKLGRFINSHNVLVALVGSNTIWRGRVADQEHFRGRQAAERAAEWSVIVEDQNSHLRGIIVDSWVRPAETDAARMQALVAAYLSGSPRASTNLNGSNFIITSSNTVALPTQTYTGVEVADVATEIARNADKELFVTIDNELAYFGHDYTGYASSLRISDLGAPGGADANATTFVPKEPRGSTLGRSQTTALRVYWGADTTAKTTRLTAAAVTETDYWEEVYWDSESVTDAAAAAKARKILDYKSQEEVTYACSIGPLSGDDVWRIKPGQTIQFKSRGARGGRTPAGTFFADSFVTLRIREINWSMPAEDIYFARLELERPRRVSPSSVGDQAKTQTPKPNSNQSPTGDTLLHFYDANDSGSDDPLWVGILPNQGGSPGDGAEASSWYYFKSSSPNRGQTSWAAVAGTTYRFTGWTSLADVNKSMSVVWRNDAAGGSGAVTTMAGVKISEDILAAGPTGRWTSFDVSLVAPTGTTSASLAKYGSTSSMSFDRIRIYSRAAADAGLATSVASQQTSYGISANNGSSYDYARADHNHGTPPRPERNEIASLVNNSGVDVDWGDIVIGDVGADDSFTLNSSNTYSRGWIGVAQSKIGSNASGPILLAGYTPVINIGSNVSGRGNFLFASNASRKAYTTNARTTGAFGQLLSTGSSPDALIWPTTDGSGGGGGGAVATDAIWDAAGDLAVGTGADTAARLALGASNTRLVSDGATALWRGPLTELHDHRGNWDGGAISGGLVDTFIDFTEQTVEPVTPASGFVRLFGSNTNLYAKDSAGAVSRLSGLFVTLNLIIDGGGAVIATGVKGDLAIDFACTITQATLLADASGSIVVDLWRDDYTSYPPTVADSITASAKPTLSSATKSQDATLTGWTKTLSAGDTIRVNVDSATTVKRVTLALKLRRT